MGEGENPGQIACRERGKGGAESNANGEGGKASLQGGRNGGHREEVGRVVSHLHPGVPELPEEGAIYPFSATDRTEQSRPLTSIGITRRQPLEAQNREPPQAIPTPGVDGHVTGVL